MVILGMSYSVMVKDSVLFRRLRSSFQVINNDYMCSIVNENTRTIN